MRKAVLTLLYFFLFQAGFSQQKPSLHNMLAFTTDGEAVLLSQYAGKKILIVNTASFCSYTYQYAALQLLYKNFKNYGFEILAFPCNDFGNQDPYADTTIHGFCTGTYSITFPLMSKVHVATGDTAPVYRWLQEKRRNGVMDTSVAWNFGKFLINESGQLVAYYASDVNPTDTAIVRWIVSPSSTLGIIEARSVFDGLKMISPNPANTTIEFLVTTEAIKFLGFNLRSMDGKVMLENKAAPLLSDGMLRINVSGIESGLYFLTASDGLRQNTQLILIAH